MFDFATVKEVRLSKGAHDSPEAGMCFMEMAAWFAGEEHSDKPACVSPALGHLGIAINDSMDHHIRDTALKPMIPHVVGTFDDATEGKRVEYICLRAFNYSLGILSPGFAVRHRGAGSYDEARSMFAHLRDIEERGRRDFHAPYQPPFAAPYSDDRGARQRLIRTVEAMMERRLESFGWHMPLKSIPMPEKLHRFPNLENVKAAGGVFSLMGEIIPDWSAALDTLREAIKLGRHDGFDVAVNLVARHERLRELIDA